MPGSQEAKRPWQKPSGIESEKNPELDFHNLGDPWAKLLTCSMYGWTWKWWSGSGTTTEEMIGPRRRLTSFHENIVSNEGQALWN